MIFRIKMTTVFVFLFSLSYSVTAMDKIVMFNLGHGEINFRDVSASKNLTAEQVSPLALVGANDYLEMRLKLTENKKVHLFGIGFNSAKSFKYDSGIRTIKRPDDERLDFRFFYEMNHYLFRNIFPNLDVAIGPNVCFSHINTARYFSTDTKLNFLENQFSAAFVLAMRYSSSQGWCFRASFANGGLFGLERTKHSLSGRMPETNFVNGWISQLEILWTWFISPSVGFSGHFRREEIVSTGRKFQYVKSENQFGVSVVYRWRGEG